MENIYNEKEIERAFNFIEKHSKKAEINCLNKSVILEIIDDIADIESEVAHIRVEAHENGEEINMIYESPENNVLFNIFNNILSENFTDYGISASSISVDIVGLALDFANVFMDYYESLDDLTRGALVFQIDDLIRFIRDKICRMYTTFETLEEITNLDKDYDFEYLNKLVERIDDYILANEGNNPLDDYRGTTTEKGERFIRMLDIMAQM